MDKSLYTYIAKSFISSFPPRILPLSIEIDLTNSCNQNCIYCNADQFRKKYKDVTKKADYINLIDSFKNIYSSLSFTPLPTITFVGGGEPTISKDFSSILEHALCNGFQCAVISNGVYIDKIFDIHKSHLSKIAWVGIDIDAGNECLYNEIRKPNNKNDFFKVCKNIQKLVDAGINTDLKILLIEKNASHAAIDDILKLAKKLSSRMVYFRFAITNGNLFIPNDEIIMYINKKAEEYGVHIRINNTRSIKRNYNKCYSFFLLPVFAADGNTYLCCENRGNKDFILCDWRSESFFDAWLSKKHIEIWNNINTIKCNPCRANIHNVNIQNNINDHKLFEQLFF